MSRPASLARASLFLAALASCGCAAAFAHQRSELEGQLERLRASVQGAIERGGRAPSCAPKALAYAEAKLEFAEQTLAADQLERATAHIDEGHSWIERALQQIESAPESCAAP